jgi:hypothetical protein
MKPLITSVLDLDSALGGNADLLLGGGLGLYLKQQHLRETEARTLLAMDRLPPARSTEDVDLFLRAEVIASADEISRYRAALNKLGFKVVRGAEWLESVPDVDPDFLVEELRRLLSPPESGSALASPVSAG